MKEILFGTTNEAKIKQIQSALIPANIIVRGVASKDMLPDVEENGQTAIENARIKALAYAQSLGEPVFSMDNSLYLSGLSPDQQPGLNVRRIYGFSDRPTDEQMLQYYSQLVSGLGGRVDAYWEFGICIATPQGKTWETVIKSPRTFVSQVSKTMINGYPLESIQIEPESGKYISEMTPDEQNIFWQKSIGQPLLDFVRSVEL